MSTSIEASRFDVRSGDGTRLAVWVEGNGPPLVMVHGSIADHTTFEPFVEVLRRDVTTYAMDRRGFGASGDTPDYAIERDFEDVAAVVDAVAKRTGGPVPLWGHSYGANCAMGAAALTGNVSRLVLYEPSLGIKYPAGSIEAAEQALADGDPGRAIVSVLVDILEMTDEEVAAMRASPLWPVRLAAAPTVPRECRAEERWRYEPGQFAGITAPTLLLSGSASPSVVQRATEDAAAAIPDSRIEVLHGHGHFAHKTDPELVWAIVHRFVASSNSRLTRVDRTRIDGVELDYELRGSGEPVVLIHWGVGVVWAQPLLEELALADGYRLLTYHRAGFAGSSRIEGSINMADHADHCRLLMRRVGIERAHIVGHSSSAMIALQLALDFPDAVQTLVLMESARPAPATEAQAEFVRAFVEPAVQCYRTGDKAGAVDTWCRGVFGPGYRAALERGLPGAFEDAVAAADAFFTQELPAVQRWSFTQEDASRVTQPVLAVLGEHTAPTFPERRDLLLAWLPNVEAFDLPGATHLLHAQNPRGMAEGLADFFARHAK
jgi:pimeloyl-ACP methyl ester carboxylesterase